AAPAHAAAQVDLAVRGKVLPCRDGPKLPDPVSDVARGAAGERRVSAIERDVLVDCDVPRLLAAVRQPVAFLADDGSGRGKVLGERGIHEHDPPGDLHSAPWPERRRELEALAARLSQVAREGDRRGSEDGDLDVLPVDVKEGGVDRDRAIEE